MKQAVIEDLVGIQGLIPQADAVIDVIRHPHHNLSVGLVFERCVDLCFVVSD